MNSKVIYERSVADIQAASDLIRRYNEHTKICSKCADPEQKPCFIGKLMLTIVVTHELLESTIKKS